MSRIKSVFLLVFILVSLGCWGCGVQSPRALVSHEGECVVNYITDSQRMKRVTFSGGYLRSSPEILPGNILAVTRNGSKAIIYGERKIDNVEWAKVTTREGITGWYSVEPAIIDGKKTQLPLDIMKKTYITTYPQISGISVDAAAKINAEINNYMEVYNYVVGPVGNNLHCLVTYNKNNLLSILFESPFVNYRIYATKDINNIKFWKNVNKYCFISSLSADAQPNMLQAERSDLQYGMVFDLKTGNRLNYQEFLLPKQDSAVADRVKTFGQDALVQKDNFYITEDKEIKVFVSHNGENPGRFTLDLTTLGGKDF